MAIDGTIKLIEKKSGYAICTPDVVTGTKYFHFHVDDYPSKTFKEEDQINWVEEPDEEATINTKTTNIALAVEVDHR